MISRLFARVMTSNVTVTTTVNGEAANYGLLKSSQLATPPHTAQSHAAQSSAAQSSAASTTESRPSATLRATTVRRLKASAWLLPTVLATTLTSVHAASVVSTNSLGELFYYTSDGDVASVSGTEVGTETTTNADGTTADDTTNTNSDNNFAAPGLPYLQLIQSQDAPLLQYARRTMTSANNAASTTTAQPWFELLSTLDHNPANRVAYADGEHADQLQAAIASNTDVVAVSALQDNNLAAQLGMLYAVDSSTVRTNQSPHSLIFLPGAEQRAALYTTWHHDASEQPAPVVLSRVMLEREQNRWHILPDSASISSAHAIDGLLSPARMQRTAWESLLFDEQINPALTRDWNREAMSSDNNEQNLDQASAAFNAMMLRESNPLRYGFLVELSAPNSSQPRWSRHYATGRLASTGSTIMPDARTVYRCDCASSGGSGLLFKFVADYANNLASGTLYVARLTAIDAIDAAGDSAVAAKATEYSIAWQRLAHGDNEEVSAWISEYEGMTADDYNADSSNYLDTAEIAQWATDWHETSAAQDSDNFSDQREYRDSRVAFLEPAQAALSIGVSPLDTLLTRIAFDGEHLLMLDQANGNTGNRTCARLLEGHLDDDYNLIRLRSLGQFTHDPQSPDTPAIAAADGTAATNGCFDTTALEPVLFGNNRFLPRTHETFWQNRNELLVLHR